jgi:septum site-determining protein MinC
VAELCVQQGRPADAVAIFRRLIERKPDDARAARWRERLVALEGFAPASPPAVEVAASATPSSSPELPPSSDEPASPTAPASAASAPAASASPVAEPVRVAAAPWAPALVVRDPVRSGTVIYAEGRDLVVMAPVSSGAELISDGHIHVYAPLRGRAVAGARGATDALIFCQRLEAELIGIDDSHLTAEELPPALVGKAVQVRLVDGALRVVAL